MRGLSYKKGEERNVEENGKDYANFLTWINEATTLHWNRGN